MVEAFQHPVVFVVLYAAALGLAAGVTLYKRPIYAGFAALQVGLLVTVTALIGVWAVLRSEMQQLQPIVMLWALSYAGTLISLEELLVLLRGRWRDRLVRDLVLGLALHNTVWRATRAYLSASFHNLFGSNTGAIVIRGAVFLLFAVGFSQLLGGLQTAIFVVLFTILHAVTIYVGTYIVVKFWASKRRFHRLN